MPIGKLRFGGGGGSGIQNITSSDDFLTVTPNGNTVDLTEGTKPVQTSASFIQADVSASYLTTDDSVFLSWNNYDPEADEIRIFKESSYFEISTIPGLTPIVSSLDPSTINTYNDTTVNALTELYYRITYWKGGQFLASSESVRTSLALEANTTADLENKIILRENGTPINPALFAGIPRVWNTGGIFPTKAYFASFLRRNGILWSEQLDKWSANATTLTLAPFNPISAPSVLNSTSPVYYDLTPTTDNVIHSIVSPSMSAITPGTTEYVLRFICFGGTVATGYYNNLLIDVSNIFSDVQALINIDLENHTSDAPSGVTVTYYQDSNRPPRNVVEIRGTTVATPTTFTIYPNSNTAFAGDGSTKVMCGIFSMFDAQLHDLGYDIYFQTTNDTASTDRVDMIVHQNGELIAEIITNSPLYNASAQGADGAFYDAREDRKVPAIFYGASGGVATLDTEGYIDASKISLRYNFQDSNMIANGKGGARGEPSIFVHDRWELQAVNYNIRQAFELLEQLNPYSENEVHISSKGATKATNDTGIGTWINPYSSIDAAIAHLGPTNAPNTTYIVHSGHIEAEPLTITTNSIVIVWPFWSPEQFINLVPNDLPPKFTGSVTIAGNDIRLIGLDFTGSNVGMFSSVGGIECVGCTFTAPIDIAGPSGGDYIFNFSHIQTSLTLTNTGTVTSLELAGVRGETFSQTTNLWTNNTASGALNLVFMQNGSIHNPCDWVTGNAYWKGVQSMSVNSANNTSIKLRNANDDKLTGLASFYETNTINGNNLLDMKGAKITWVGSLRSAANDALINYPVVGTGTTPPPAQP